jgi:hypothetical protein
MPLQSTSGAASYDAFGGGTVAKVNYIEDFFQSYLRTGTGASATVTTGLDGSTKETLVWTKSRSAATNHKLTDNVRGATKALSSNTTSAEVTDSQGLTAFSATGYTLGTNTDYNNSGATYVDWQWVSQPKFFDIVTYTGTGVARTIAHSLGSVPGCIIVKSTTSVSNWYVYHRSLATNQALKLNSTAAIETGTIFWNNTAATSTEFSLGTTGDTNGNGQTFFAYLFAHDAGGFGLTGTDNVISCGSFTTDGSANATVTLGYEPQWVLVKNTSADENWFLIDTMRGWNVADSSRYLRANASNAESGQTLGFPTATGFTFSGFSASAPYIYIAIRRGPMKVPTLGTSVFSPVIYSGDGTSSRLITTPSFPTDLMIGMARNQVQRKFFWDRLRGATAPLDSTSTDAEASSGTALSLTSVQTGFLVTDNGASYTNTSGYDYDSLCFRRAPGFFDEVCYTGNGTAGRAVAHNLAAVPEFMIIKYRNDVQSWFVFHSFGTSIYRRQFLNLTESTGGSGDYSYGSGGMYQKPDATNFYLEAVNANQSGGTFVAYLFATVSGVSKVFSYTGNGSSQTINCGFTGGSRFVMIKRTDSTGDWYVWDSARGIVAGNDPHLSLNTTAAEVTTDDSVDTDNTGFIVNQVAATNVNVSSATYIGLAIA